MIAKDLINYMIPPLKSSDEVEKAMLWMEELRLSELPVADQGKFLGMLSEETLYDEEVLQGTVGAIELNAKEAVVPHDAHYYNVLKMAYSLGTRLIAVEDDAGHYMGVVSIENVVEAFADSTFVNTPGAILVLSMDHRDYSLAEISRVIEMDEAKILSSHIMQDQDDPSKVRLTLKINKEEVTHLTTALESKGFPVAESFNKNQMTENDQERFDALMKYLKI